MNRVFENRVLRRQTQYVLGLQTQIHQSRLSLIERGLILPREDEKKRLAKAFGIRVDDLFPTEVKSNE